jgi:hypothetical protein
MKTNRLIIKAHDPLVDLTGPALAAVGFNEQISGVNEQASGRGQSD